MTIVMFDTNETIDKSLFGVLPVGEYTAMLVSSDVSISQNNPENKYANLKWQIVDGEFAGRSVYFILNYWNTNPKTVAWAKKHLKDICDAVGFSGLLNSITELHGKVATIKVKIQEDPKYPDKNVIVGWSKPKTTYTITTSNSASSSSVQKTDPLQNMWGNPQQ